MKSSLRIAALLLLPFDNVPVSLKLNLQQRKLRLSGASLSDEKSKCFAKHEG